MNTPKKLHLFKARLYAIVGLIMFIALYFSKDRVPPRLSKLEAASLAASIVFAYALYHFIRYKRTPAEARFYNLSKRPPQEQITVLKRSIGIMLLACSFMTYSTYHDIAAFESGESPGFRGWAPVVYAYEHFGSRAALLIWPALCLTIVTICFFKMQKAKAILASTEPVESAH